MIVEKILSGITLEKIKKELEKIKATKLPPKLEECVREYEKVGDRSRFLWQGLYAYAPCGSLPGVIKKYRISTLETKIISMIFVTLADDLADKYKDKELLDEVLGIPFNRNFKISKRLPKKQQRYLISALKIWNIFENEIKKYPYYDKFEDFFKFDYQQVLNAVKFGYLLNKNLNLLESKESEIYLPYNMQVFVNCDIDLMCMPDFKNRETGCIRKVIYKSQIMARIGNCLGTWERELEEKDFSSFVFIYAIKNNIVTIEDIMSGSKEEIKEKIKLSNCEKYLLEEWEKNYNEIKNLILIIKSFDGYKYLKNSEEILKIYIICRGMV